MRQTASRVLLLAATLCLAFSFIGAIVQGVLTYPCLCGPATLFSDALLLSMCASVPLTVAGLLLAPMTAEPADTVS